MQAAAIVSNLVYTINGISAYAATCTFTHNWYVTDRRGQENNWASCSSECSQIWAGHTWHLSYNSANRSCTCIATNRHTATGTWQTVAYGACGRRAECAGTYRECDTCPNRSAARAGDVMCNSDNNPGYAGYRTETCFSHSGSISCSDVCACCPCTGTAGMGENCMGSQNSAGPYMLVYADPYSNSMKGCYIKGTGGLDNTGTFEYTQESACYFR